jgi:hypothetical protein
MSAKKLRAASPVKQRRHMVVLKAVVDSDETMVPSEAIQVRHGLKQLKQGTRARGSKSNMSWVCEFTQDAQEDLKKLPRNIQERVARVLK